MVFVHLLLVVCELCQKFWEILLNIKSSEDLSWNQLAPCVFWESWGLIILYMQFTAVLFVKQRRANFTISPFKSFMLIFFITCRVQKGRRVTQDLGWDCVDLILFEKPMWNVALSICVLHMQCFWNRVNQDRMGTVLWDRLDRQDHRDQS